ncbi:hypothetical protein CRG98_031139 [Punica granatum]|uniref:Uncharacterized protein n=1 Tax=Punica granatum TaxID=22663 RepID=A0A2I0IWZ4_PUNGR|nr:hypothetical protein CRG98_031139 [Punica granatum]
MAERQEGRKSPAARTCPNLIPLRADSAMLYSLPTRSCTGDSKFSVSSEEVCKIKPQPVGQKMASHDQSYKAGEAHGRLEEGKNQMVGTMTDKTEAAKDKTYETAQAGKDKTQETAHATKEKTKESTKQSGSYISEKAGAAK